MYVFHSTRRIVFASSCFFLVAEDRDDSCGCQHFHAEASLIDNCRELNDAVAAEDGIVWVGYSHHVEGYELRSLGVAFSEGHIQLYFA